MGLMSDILEYVATIIGFLFRFVSNYFWFIVVAFVALTFFRRKSAHKKMQEIALKLGLQFKKNTYLKQIEDRTASVLQQQTTEIPKVLEFVSKAIDFALPLVSPWEIYGKWNDVPIRVYPDVNENKGRYTIVRADREDARAIGLHIVAEKFLGRTFGNNDITSGNEELDKLVFITANDSDQAKMLLMSPYLQDAILQAVKFNRSINIEDQHVSFYYPGTLKDEEKLKTALDHLSRTALALRSGSR
jgi:hypothetical protein